jgi:hypothetical protein
MGCAGLHRARGQQLLELHGRVVLGIERNYVEGHKRLFMELRMNLGEGRLGESREGEDMAPEHGGRREGKLG